MSNQGTPARDTAAAGAAQSPGSAESPGTAQASTSLGLHPAEHWLQLAQEELEPEEDSDADSALGSDVASSTTSVTESILKYRTINGRTYHSERGDANYWASNDDKQNEAWDVAHHFQTLLLSDKLFLSPIKKDIQTALDVGTGTGIWAIDFADEYPNAQVVGTDISPIQPTWVPPNLRFEIEDCSQEWSFKPDSMDFIHMRYLYGSIRDWDALYREAFKACRPGGWVESSEAHPEMESDDREVPPTSAISEWGKFFLEGGRRNGRTFEVLSRDLQIKGMKEAGFVDLHVENFKVPIGGWPKDPKRKELGRYVHLCLDPDYEGFLLFMASQFLDWTKEQVLVYCAQLRREIRSLKYHPYFRQRVVYGRKPEKA